MLFLKKKGLNVEKKLFLQCPSGSVVTYPQLKTMLANHDVQLFDVREPHEYQEGRISDAVNIPRMHSSNL